MRARVRKQRGSGIWVATGISRLTGEPVAYAPCESWEEAMAWATGAVPRPRRRNLRLLELMLGGRR